MAALTPHAAENFSCLKRMTGENLNLLSITINMHAIAFIAMPTCLPACAWLPCLPRHACLCLKNFLRQDGLEKDWRGRQVRCCCQGMCLHCGGVDLLKRKEKHTHPTPFPRTGTDRQTRQTNCLPLLHAIPLPAVCSSLISCYVYVFIMPSPLLFLPHTTWDGSNF